MWNANNFCLFVCLLVRTCFVAPKFKGPKDEPRPASMVHQVDYPLDGGRILRIEGQIRYTVQDTVAGIILIKTFMNLPYLKKSYTKL